MGEVSGNCVQDMDFPGSDRDRLCALFVDDLPVHHESVAKHAPEVWRLHMIGEPRLAGVVPPAPHAHARIDDWREAVRWIEARFAQGAADPDPEQAKKEQA